LLAGAGAALGAFARGPLAPATGPAPPQPARSAAARRPVKEAGHRIAGWDVPGKGMFHGRRSSTFTGSFYRRALLKNSDSDLSRRRAAPPVARRRPRGLR